MKGQNKHQNHGRNVGIIRPEIFKIMIKMLRVLMTKVDNTHEEMDNVSRETEILRENFLKAIEQKH